jgi:hypothetical protein
MSQVNILNVPNYYCSFYQLGFERIASVRFSPRKEFAHLNGKPFLVIEYKGKVAVIENDDPVGVDMPSYSDSDLYFATNKLLAREDYNMDKVMSIYPHYSIDNAFDYLKLFGVKGAINLGPKEFLRQFYNLYRRPDWRNMPHKSLEGDYVFFSGSMWKKEKWANQVRAAFIQACQANPNITFEGGMNPRSDGDRCGLPPEVMDQRYTPKDFAEKSSRSVMAFPFKIDIPTVPEHGKHIHYVQDPAEFSEVLTFVMKNPAYREKVARGGKSYFDEYCLPEIQAKRILDLLEKS